MFIVRSIIHKKKPFFKREEPSVSFANDVIYSSAIDVEREDITGSQANDKKVVHYINKFK